MHPLRPDILRLGGGRRPRHGPAFTLIEMLVSMTVLALALTVVGVVFRITAQTASQSAAYSETHTWVRQLVSQIKEDLRGCDPAQSVLVLVGRTQAAALTSDGLAAGRYYRVLVGDPTKVGNFDPEFAPEPINPSTTQYSNPRADVLMFFTNRAVSSRAPNPNAVNDPYASGTKFAPVRVVYGHAAIGSPVWGATGPSWPALGSERHIVNIDKMSSLPANAWHLSRVATILQDPNGFGLNIDRFSLIASQSIPLGKFYLDRSWNMPGDAAVIRHRLYLDALTYPAFDPNASPYGFLTDGTWDPQSRQRTWSLMFGTNQSNPAPNYHVATVLDEVPLELQSNLAVHMLPGCAWFQVEFLMPEDPRNSIEFTDPNKAGEFPRWVEVPPGAMYAFVPDTPENRQGVALQVDANGRAFGRLATFARIDGDPAGDTNSPGTAVSNRVIRMWPYAIRITIRAYDTRGRLTEPIVRTVVHRFE